MIKTGRKELYPNFAVACQLMLTLPVSSYSSDCSFSALKFVENSLHNTMMQTRLSDLMVLACQSERILLDFHTVADEFWNRGTHR